MHLISLPYAAHLSHIQPISPICSPYIAITRPTQPHTTHISHRQPICNPHGHHTAHMQPTTPQALCHPLNSSFDVKNKNKKKSSFKNLIFKQSHSQIILKIPLSNNSSKLQFSKHPFSNNFPKFQFSNFISKISILK